MPEMRKRTKYIFFAQTFYNAILLLSTKNLQGSIHRPGRPIIAAIDGLTSHLSDYVDPMYPSLYTGF